MIRSALRAVGYIVSELIPAQAIRCCLDRDYSDAMYQAGVAHDGAEQRAEYEAEEEVAEPAVDYSTICSQCGQPYSASACGPTHAVIAAERGTGAINDGEPQRVTLSGREYERYLDGALNAPVDQPTSPPWLHDLIEQTINFAVDCGLPEGLVRDFINHPGRLPIDDLLDRHLTDDAAGVQSSAVVSRNEPADGPEAVSSILPARTEPASGHSGDVAAWFNSAISLASDMEGALVAARADVVDYVTPAIAEVLSEHHPLELADRIRATVHCRSADGRIHDEFADRAAWREHVAPILAAHIVTSLTAQPD